MVRRAAHAQPDTAGGPGRSRRAPPLWGEKRRTGLRSRRSIVSELPPRCREVRRRPAARPVPGPPGLSHQQGRFFLLPVALWRLTAEDPDVGPSGTSAPGTPTSSHCGLRSFDSGKALAVHSSDTASSPSVSSFPRGPSGAGTLPLVLHPSDPLSGAPCPSRRRTRRDLLRLIC